MVVSINHYFTLKKRNWQCTKIFKTNGWLFQRLWWKTIEVVEFKGDCRFTILQVLLICFILNQLQMGKRPSWPRQKEYQKKSKKIPHITQRCFSDARRARLNNSLHLRHFRLHITQNKISKKFTKISNFFHIGPHCFHEVFT